MDSQRPKIRSRHSYPSALAIGIAVALASAVNAATVNITLEPGGITPDQALIGVGDTVTFSCDSSCGCSATDLFNGLIGGISPVAVSLSDGETSAPLGPATGAGWISYGAFVCSPAGQGFIFADSGPTIRMREPKVVSDDVHSGPSGVGVERVIFSEPVLFGPSDIEIIDDLGAPVAFSVAGSGTDLMVISFDTPLFQDTYTITIQDSLVAATYPGIPFDGDDDGVAGGQAMIVMEHGLIPSTTPSVGSGGLVALACVLILTATVLVVRERQT